MDDWESDHVTTADGVVVPVRATAHRPSWDALPALLRTAIERRLGAAVVSAWSAGTGFTPGFASRLTLSDGRDVFVKAASSGHDRLHGFPLSDAYREEIRKLQALPDGIGAPPLLWHDELVVDAEHWVVAAYMYVDGAPPRRPWRSDQLVRVLDKLAEVSARLTPAPEGLELDTVAFELMETIAGRLEAVLRAEGPSEWLDQVSGLSTAAAGLIEGDSVVHMDLRDDNVLIDRAGDVWFVDWNWPVRGAGWVDAVCILLSAQGDGLDVETLLGEHPFTRDVDPHAIDALLAVLWSFWAVAVREPVPISSPHLRDHQRWYRDVTRAWLTERLAARSHGRRRMPPERS
jgi:hypothetical protein